MYGWSIFSVAVRAQHPGVSPYTPAWRSELLDIVATWRDLTPQMSRSSTSRCLPSITSARKTPVAYARHRPLGFRSALWSSVFFSTWSLVWRNGVTLRHRVNRHARQCCTAHSHRSSTSFSSVVWCGVWRRPATDTTTAASSHHRREQPKPGDAATVNANQAWQTPRPSYRVIPSYRDFWNEKRETFSSDAVAASQSSPRLLRRPVDMLLGRSRVPASEAINVDEFHWFFTDKVEAVRAARTTAGGLQQHLLLFRLPATTRSLLMTSFPLSVGCRIRVASPTHFQYLSWSSLWFDCSVYDEAIQSLLVKSHCAESVQVSALQATAQEARPQLCRSTVLQADFQFIGVVQASCAYCFPAALQLPVCGRPSVCSLYRDGRYDSVRRPSSKYFCVQWWRCSVCPRPARPVRSIWYRRPRHHTNTSQGLLRYRWCCVSQFITKTPFNTVWSFWYYFVSNLL